MKETETSCVYDRGSYIVAEEIADDKKLSHNFMDVDKKKILDEEIADDKKLSNNFMNVHKNKIMDEEIADDKKLSNNFTNVHKNKIMDEEIADDKKLSNNFTNVNKKKIMDEEIADDKKLSNNFMNVHKKKILDEEIADDKNLSNNFMKVHKNKIMDEEIADDKKLSNNSANVDKKKILDEEIADDKKLSNNFMKVHKNKILDEEIADKKLSNNFTNVDKKKILNEEIADDKKLSNNFMDVNKKKILDEEIADDKKLSNNFMKVHKTKILDEEFRLAIENLPIGSATLPTNWNNMTVQDQRNWVTEKIADNCPNLPKSLLFIIVGIAINGDCGRSLKSIPDWLDRKKFQRGQNFAMANYVGITFAEMISLPMLFSIDLKPLIISGKSSEPFTAFKRYLSTVRRVRNWYSSDVWTEGTAGYEDIKIVRKMHSNIRKKLSILNCEKIYEAARIQNTWSTERVKIREDFRESCQEAASGQCPLIFSKEDQSKKPKILNQAEMALTQFGFMGLVILYPEKFGIHGASEEDIEAFCHLWRGLGYLLGIEDEFNVCKGSVEEIKQRARDSIEYWIKPNLREVTPEWEHMIRCLTEGISYYLPGITYELTLLFMADVLAIPMPRLKTSLSFSSWIRFYLMKFSWSFTTRFPGIMSRINGRVNRYIDRALSLTDEELDVLRKKSERTLAKGIADTIAVEKNPTIAKHNVWRAATFFLFSATFVLLNLPIIRIKILG